MLEPEPDDDGQASAVTRLGTAAFGGAVAALFASLPAALRLSDASAGRAVAWIALSGLATPFAVVAVGLLRRSRVGAKLLARERTELWAAAFLTWATLELLLASAFATVLRKHTHHHGLAGVTFAVFALLSGALGALLVARAADRVSSLGARAQRGALVASAIGAFVVVVAAAVGAAGGEGLHTASGVVDFFAFAVACTIASSRALARRKSLAMGGVPIAALVVAVGLVSLRAHPSLGAALEGDAPIHALLLSSFGR